MTVKYRIYTTRSLEEAIHDLVLQKRNKGYSVELRFVEDLSTPKHDAIRSEVLRDRPDFLLLVGDGDTVPGYPLEDRHDPIPIPFDSDTYYSTPDGSYTTPNGSYTPTIPTGRISSNHYDTVENVCRTLISYPIDSSTNWRQRIVHTGWLPRAPSAPDYKQDAAVQCLREAGHYFTNYFEFEKPGSEEQRRRWGASDSSKVKLINTINRGTVIVRYLGHGDTCGWDNIGNNENFMNSNIDDIQANSNLPNGIQVNSHLPFIISATCKTGFLDESPSFSEKWQIDLKAIGILAADISSDTYFNDRLTQEIIKYIVSGRERIIGHILVKAFNRVWRHYRNAPDREFFWKTCLMYRYLGDPDTNLAVPRPRKTTLGETSNAGPSLAASNSTLLLGWTGTTDRRLNFMSTQNGSDFSNKVTLRDTSPNSLSLCRLNGKFIVAWVGLDHKINLLQSEDGINWTDKVTLNEKSWSAPAIRRFSGNIYLVWRGGPTNNRINIMRSTDAVSWIDKRTLIETTISGTALTATLSNLIVAWRGGPNNNKINIMISSDGLSFHSKQTLTDTTTSRLALTNYLGRPMLSWGGSQNRLLNVMEGNETRNYADTQWGSKITWPEKCMSRTGPALAKLGNNLVCAWTGTDRRLNTMLYPVAPI